MGAYGACGECGESGECAIVVPHLPHFLHVEGVTPMSSSSAGYRPPERGGVSMPEVIIISDGVMAPQVAGRLGFGDLIEISTNAIVLGRGKGAGLRWGQLACGADNRGVPADACQLVHHGGVRRRNVPSHARRDGAAGRARCSRSIY
jgi:hypothetical protein